MSLVVDEHREFLSDGNRVAAFRKAIQEVVRPGDTVLDLGAGTGIMGLLACEAGAGRVYSIDADPILGLAQEVCRANGYQDRVTFLKGLSTRLSLPEKVDVVVADQIGRFGFEAGVFQYFQDARRRFLKPGGKTIPSRIDFWICPVHCQERFDDIEFWKGKPAGFDFTPAHPLAVNTGYPVAFETGQLLAEPVCGASVDLAEANPESLRIAGTTTATRNQRMHGIGGWFSALLSPSVTLSNSPLAKDRIRRRNVFFPLKDPVELAAGDEVSVEIKVVPSEITATWSVRVKAAATKSSADRLKAQARHSTLAGMLVFPGDLRKTAPSFVPQLTPWGAARKSVLELCDGKRTLDQIEQELLRQYPGLFPSSKEASVFVSEVVIPYCK